MMKKKLFFACLALTGAMVFSACGQEPTETESSEILTLDMAEETTTAATTTAATTEETEAATTTAAKTTAAEKKTSAASTTAAKETTTTKKADTTTTTEKTTEKVTETEETEAPEEIVTEEVTEIVEEPQEIVEIPVDERPLEEAVLDMLFSLGTDCSDYLASHADYINVQKQGSCHGEGLDCVYTYNDYTLYVFEDAAGTGQYLTDVDLTTGLVSNEYGIHVGSSREEVETAYGMSDGMIDMGDGRKLVFTFDGDTVMIITYFVDFMM